MQGWLVRSQVAVRELAIVMLREGATSLILMLLPSTGGGSNCRKVYIWKNIANACSEVPQVTKRGVLATNRSTSGYTLSVES
jgi:hypothetical protein